MAEHLAANIREIANYAGDIAHTDPERVLTSLGRLRAMLENMRGECREHADAIRDARQFGGLPEWDVLGDDNLPARDDAEPGASA